MWVKTIGTRSVDQWADDVSAITLPQTKTLLAADRAPTVDELLALPVVGTESRPGVYAI